MSTPYRSLSSVKKRKHEEDLANDTDNIGELRTLVSEGSAELPLANNSTAEPGKKGKGRKRHQARSSAPEPIPSPYGTRFSDLAGELPLSNTLESPYDVALSKKHSLDAIDANETVTPSNFNVVPDGSLDASTSTTTAAPYAAQSPEAIMEFKCARLAVDLEIENAELKTEVQRLLNYIALREDHITDQNNYMDQQEQFIDHLQDTVAQKD